MSKPKRGRYVSDVLIRRLCDADSKKQGNVSLDMAEAASQRNMMNDEASVARAIHAKLMAAFAPVALDVVDESALHAGHSGARREGESHFRVRIVSAGLAGLSRLDPTSGVY